MIWLDDAEHAKLRHDAKWIGERDFDEYFWDMVVHPALETVAKSVRTGDQAFPLPEITFDEV